MPEWWNAGAPYLQAGGVVLALLLGAGNLAWLFVQARRSKVTHRIALANGTVLEQRRAERRSELAEQALLAIQSVCLDVHHWSLILCMEARQDRGSAVAAREGVQSAVAFGSDFVDPLRWKINAVRARALVHLHDDERQLLSDAEGLLVQVRLDADGWLKKIDSIDREHAREMFLGLNREADALRERAEHKLGPVARFGQPEKAD